MLMCIVNSEKEYLDLIADLSKYGLHVPNQYANPDKDDMSVIDRFEKLPVVIAEEYLGVRDYEWKVTVIVDENGEEWEEEPCGGDDDHFDRTKLHFCPELQKHLVTPQAEDYPILIMWEWGDDFDRMGSIRKRYFDWVKLSDVPYSHKNGISFVKKKFTTWIERYGKKLKELNRLAKVRLAAARREQSEK